MSRFIFLVAMVIVLTDCGSDSPAGPADSPPAPSLQVSPSSVALTSEVQGESSDATVMVKNSGGGTLNWSANANQTWIELSPVSGSLNEGQSTTVTVSVADGVFAAGSYTGAVSVSANTLNSPATVTTALTVTQSEAVSLAAGTPVGGISGSSGSELLFGIDVPSASSAVLPGGGGGVGTSVVFGSSLVVMLQGSGSAGNADLYVRHGSPPTTSEFDCRSDSAGNDEECVIDDPSSGTWYALIVGATEYSGLSIVADQFTYHTVTVTGSGSGYGTITSDPAGINCAISVGTTSGNCSARFDVGTTVTLTPSEVAVSRFSGWSGNCSGRGECVLSDLIADGSATAQFDDMGLVFRDAYQQEFAIDIPNPAVVRSEWAPERDLHEWLSTAYLDSKQYRLFWWPDGSVTSGSVTIHQLPKGDIRVIVVAVDHGNTNIAEVLDNLWPTAQNEIDARHASLAEARGYVEPLIRFTHTNVLALRSEIGDPRDRNSVIEFLAGKGYSEQDFDIVVSMDLDADNVAGGFTFLRDFVYMGCFFCTEGGFYSFSASDLTGLANAIYHHEVGHIWGWDHDWTFCTPNFNFDLCQGFMTAPTLWGWEDTDGDGIPEILDSTPYGRL